MKKNIRIAMFSATLAFSFAVHAEGVYVGANLGNAEIKASAMGESTKDHTTGFKLLAGYDFSKNFGVEAGYANLGKFSDAGSDYKPSALYVAATGTLPLSNEFSLIAKLGITSNRSKFSFEGVSETFNTTAAVIGVGAAYKLSNSMSLVAEYDNFGNVFDVEANGVRAKIKADMFSLGLRVAF